MATYDAWRQYADKMEKPKNIPSVPTAIKNPAGNKPKPPPSTALGGVKEERAAQRTTAQVPTTWAERNLRMAKEREEKRRLRQSVTLGESRAGMLDAALRYADTGAFGGKKTYETWADSGGLADSPDAMLEQQKRQKILADTMLDAGKRYSDAGAIADNKYEQEGKYGKYEGPNWDTFGTGSVDYYRKIIQDKEWNPPKALTKPPDAGGGSGYYYGGGGGGGGGGYSTARRQQAQSNQGWYQLATNWIR